MAHLKQPAKLRLIDLLDDFDEYVGLPEGLVQLPVPRTITIAKQRVAVPQDLDSFMDAICYGQRLFFARAEQDDFGVILRVMDGYYYPVIKKTKWDADEAILFGKYILTCMVEEVYPVAMHLVELISQMCEREKKALHREPTKMELAAGIEKLNVFAELSSLDFLRDAMKITTEEVLQTPYKECLVRFMLQKETEEYKERFMKLSNEQMKAELEKNKPRGYAKR